LGSYAESGNEKEHIANIFQSSLHLYY